jgi:prevent-host-death family protein
MTKMTISLAQAKSRLSELVVRAAYGREEFIITRRGRPAALLTSVAAGSARNHLADVKGWLEADDSFFDDLQEIRRRSRRRGPRVFS